LSPTSRARKATAIVEQGLLILKNLDHRGAVGADPLMGDGAGILIQIPDAVLSRRNGQAGRRPCRRWRIRRRHVLPAAGKRLAHACEEEIERAVVPKARCCSAGAMCRSIATMPMSPTVKAKEPVIRQVFVGRGPDVIVTDALERKLYIIRRRAANAIKALKLKHGQEFYVPSFSARTVVYKGLLLADQVGEYYLDLQDKRTACRPWRWCTSVSRPTPSRPGIWRTRSA
jgi:glutamate synthase (NADPH/NADH) large chain